MIGAEKRGNVNNFEVCLIKTYIWMGSDFQHQFELYGVQYREKIKWFWQRKKDWRRVEFNGLTEWPEQEAKYIERAILENGVIESGYSDYVTPACLIY